MYYIYDEDDFRTPEVVYERDWFCKVIAEHVNSFETKEEAEKWCREMNSRYISRRPYIVKESK